MGFLNRTIEAVTGKKCEKNLLPVYKMVDTCAAEFEAQTPYFYSTFDKENEGRKSLLKIINQIRKKLSYSVRVLSESVEGIEFDYAWFICLSLKKQVSILLL